MLTDTQAVPIDTTQKLVLTNTILVSIDTLREKTKMVNPIMLVADAQGVLRDQKILHVMRLDKGLINVMRAEIIVDDGSVW